MTASAAEFAAVVDGEQVDDVGQGRRCLAAERPGGLPVELGRCQEQLTGDGGLLGGRAGLGADVEVQLGGQELADQFVGMYVNKWTLDYGDRGRAAVQQLLGEAVDAGIVPDRGEVDFVEPA